MPSRQHMEIYEKDQLLPEVVTTTLYKCSSLCNASELKLCKQEKKDNLCTEIPASKLSGTFWWLYTTPIKQITRNKA